MPSQLVNFFKPIVFLLVFILVSSSTVAQKEPCSHIKKIPLDTLSKRNASSLPSYFKVLADSTIDYFSISLPCENWKIYHSDSLCNKNISKHEFNIFGVKTITENEVLMGYCNCKYCSKGARTMNFSESKYYVISTKNCSGKVNINKTLIPGYALPSWATKQWKPGQRFELEKLFFWPNKSMFIESSLPELHQLYLFLKSKPKQKIQIVGHVNGPKQKNSRQFQKLSENRAKAVYNYLVKKGINKLRLTYLGKGNTEMLFPKPNKELEMQRNRRVEIILL